MLECSRQRRGHALALLAIALLPHRVRAVADAPAGHARCGTRQRTARTPRAHRSAPHAQTRAARWRAPCHDTHTQTMTQRKCVQCGRRSELNKCWSRWWRDAMITGRRKFNFIHLVFHLHDELFRFSPLSALESHDCHTHQLCVHNPADRNARSAHTTLESTRARSQRLRTHVRIKRGRPQPHHQPVCMRAGSRKVTQLDRRHWHEAHSSCRPLVCVNT